MRVVLVGAAADRARVRAALPEDLEVVAEASTQAEARAVPDIDAWVIARTTSDAELPTAPETIHAPSATLDRRQIPQRKPCS